MCTMCVNIIVFKPYNCILAINAIQRMKTHKRDPLEVMITMTTDYYIVVYRLIYQRALSLDGIRIFFFLM